MTIEKKIRAKAYLRVSTLEQANSDRASLDTQRGSIINFAKSQGYDLSLQDDFYIDTSSGATTENRPALQRLLDDARNGKVRVVLAWRIDRLGRSVLDNETIFKEFDKYNITFKSVTEPIDTASHQGKAFRQFLSTFAEMERESITQRMITGRYTKTARDGTNFGAEAPFGYRLENKRYVIDEEAAKKIRYIFELYLRFKSIKRVVKELQAQKFTMPILVRDLQIRRILKQTKYTGRMSIKKNTYEKKHPEIISDVVFNKAQEILKENFQNHASVGLIAPGFFIRDVARCGECGHQMVKNQTKSQKKTGGNIYYYCCSVRRKNAQWGCKHRKAYRKDFLENKVLEEIFKHIENLSADDSYLFKHLKINSQAEITRLRIEIKNKEDSLQGKKRAKQRILNALEKSDDADVLERLEKIKQEISNIEDSILEAKVKLEREQTKKDDFKSQSKFYKEFKSTWAEANEQERRDLINDLVKSARIFLDGRIEIEYNF